MCMVLCETLLTLAGCSERTPQSILPNIHVLGVDQLDAPAVAVPGLYKPSFVFDSAGASVTGFFVELAAGRPETLVVSTTRSDGTRSGQLVRIATPQDATVLREDEPGWSLPEEARGHIAAGRGVFWLLPATADGLRVTVAVALPSATISPIAMITFHTHTATDGAPLAGARIEVATAFYYMVAVGDSAMWGNGLLEADKFRTLVANHIQRITGRRVVTQVYAVNGAGILPAENTYPCNGQCAGEVPRGMTSIPEQVELIQSPELIELVLLDGCANDVGLNNILSGGITPEELADMTRMFCGAPMIELLEQVIDTTPAAQVVVTGYFPVLSSDSDVSDLEEFLTAIGVAVFADDLAELLDALVPNAESFVETSNAELRRAVDTVNDRLDAPRVAFASPNFGPQNATFASDAWLWGLTSRGNLSILSNFDITLRLFPEDPKADTRANACGREGAWHDVLSCLFTSLAHPNVAGARAFANAIIGQLEALGAIPDELQEQ